MILDIKRIFGALARFRSRVLIFVISLSFASAAALMWIADGFGKSSSIIVKSTDSFGRQIAVDSSGSISTGTLRVLWIVANSPEGKVLKSWNFEEIQKQFKVKVQHEKDPATGNVVRWDGITLSELIENAMEPLSIQERAQVDLVVLQNGKGRFGVVPRAVVTKYPMMLAYRRSGKAIEDRGPYYSIVPWTSKSSIRSEVLPINKYFVPNVQDIVLTSYRQRYNAGIFVNYRKDPLVLRGEKRFIQTCMGCHNQEWLPPPGNMAEQFGKGGRFSSSHSVISGMPVYSELDRRAIKSYLETIQRESQTVASEKQQGK